MGKFRAMFDAKIGNLVNKYPHFFDAYERHAECFRGKEVYLLEIGVDSGGSLDLWREFLGVGAKIYGIDPNPECKSLEKHGYTIFTGSQSDRAFLDRVVSEMPRIDILIDDGGHRMEQQIITFETLFDKVSEDGLYVCEDTNTSYWVEYGGGYKRRSTFIEYSKNFVDYIHAWHSRTPKLPISGFTRSVKSVHFYDSLVVIEKGVVEAPKLVRRGERTVPLLTGMTGNPSFEEPLRDRLIRSLPWFIRKHFN